VLQLARLHLQRLNHIHGYDSVSADVIWLVVTRYMPILEKEVKELLK